MHLLDKYFVAFPRSPDDPAATADPVADPAASAAADPAPVTDPPAPGPEPIREPAAKPAPQMVPVTVVAELRGKARSLENELAQARRETADAKAIADRLSRGEKPAERGTVVQAERASAATQPADGDVDRRAEFLVFQRDVAAVRDAGMAQYGQQFTDTIRALAAYGADDDAFVSQALAVARGNAVPAHVLLHDLAQDGEKTVALVGMTPTQRMAELTRIAMAQAAPKVVDPTPAEPNAGAEPKPAVSKAPAPKPALAPVGAVPDIDPSTPEGNDKMSDADFEKWYKAKYFKRSA